MLSAEASHAALVEGWLRRAGWLGAHEVITELSPPGEGNMNLVLRVRTNTARTVIVKHARAWVERYPDVPAPVDRQEAEAAFYAQVALHPDVARNLPTVIAHDPSHALLALEDLGAGADLTGVYTTGTLDEGDLDAVIAWAEALHRLPLGPPLPNRALRALNHAHVFVLPFAALAPRPLDALLPGLEAARQRTLADARLVPALAALGERYLADGPSLLHGDLHPGSLLRAARGLCVLDPEFAFHGDPAFDRGVLAAHLLLADVDEALIQRALATAPAGTRAFAGAEVLRRLFGVAQLPLRSDLGTREALAARASAWVVEAA